MADSTILGLDLGTNSVGWCLLAASDGHPTGIIASGSRIFDAGMDGDVASGRAEPRNLARRQARQQRRQTFRRAHRLRKVYGLLQQAGLLPAGNAATALPALDALLRQQHCTAGVECLDHVLPYWLRAQGLDRPLSPHELGRTLYHLAQRRGYLTNRRTPRKADDDAGVVEAGIQSLQAEIAQSGSRTLGEHFSRLDPHKRRIRQRWTSREMFVREFDAIIARQAPHHPQLAAEFCQRLRKAVFRQRPLKSARRLVGRCSLEPARRRAPIALLALQRFRVLQQVCNCRVITADGVQRPLTDGERATLIERLHRAGDATFTQAKKLLKLPGASFSIEEGGEERFVGNRTNAKLADIFGERWWSLSDQQRDQVVTDVRSFRSAEALARRAMRIWGLDEPQASRLAQLELEPGYASISLAAARKLLDLMERGMAYSTAVKQLYGGCGQGPAVELLSPVNTLPNLRNPVVSRVLTELRKVVNAVIRHWGKPGCIRVELSRDMRRTKQQRVLATKRNRANERSRAAAATRLLRELGIQNPRDNDIQKVLLADECNWLCPYTGRAISMSDLCGPNPQFDIEHIIPFSRSLDDSFVNKTLCHHEENRHRKANRTPHEAYAADAQRWEEILQRVGRLKGDAAAEKLRRFKMTDIESVEDFAARLLSDTRYASALAADYLASLYGGLWDVGGVRRIQAGRGGVTAYLRAALGLNGLVGGGPVKTRDDHRHHAVDALVVALTEPGLIAALSRAAQEPWGPDGRRRRFESLPAPWPTFAADAAAAVGKIVVSHRVSRKVAGALHEETNYARVVVADGHEFRTRKPLAALSPREVGRIADPAVRAIVADALKASGLFPKDAFADPAKHPCRPAGDGRQIPIHSVRIACPVAARPIGRDGFTRYVATDSNHHLEVVAVLNAQGNEKKWIGCVVDRLEAARRLRAGLPVVQTDHGAGKQFKFSLCPGETIRLTHPQGQEPTLGVVRSISRGKTGAIKVEFVPATDARKGELIKAAGLWFTRSPDSLREAGAQKVAVSPLGEVRDAAD